MMRILACLVTLGLAAAPAWAERAAPIATPATQAVAPTGPPELKSHAAFVMDAETGAEVFGKSANEVRAIASTTKIFVAMVVRDRDLALEAYTTIAKSDAQASRGGSRTRLDVGQAFRNIDLLRAMLISSDNRAPTALARAAGLSPEALIEAMNKKAKALGLRRTKFTDTSGLRGNVSTAREMALALRAALADKTLREIMGTTWVEVVSKSGRARIGYGNTNQPLVAGTFDVIGGKTGFTTPAGYCYITGATFAGRELIFVFLGAPAKSSRFADFGRVARWLEAGAPGSPRALPSARVPTGLAVRPRGRVAK